MHYTPNRGIIIACELMDLENDIPDTPTARQTTITLANAAHQASTTNRVSADAVRIINLLNAKASTDHVGGNLLVLAEETQIGETDLEIYRSIAELQLGIPLLILFYILYISTRKALSIQVRYTPNRGII